MVQIKNDGGAEENREKTDADRPLERVENFEGRMENWRRWAGSLGAGRGTCCSIEKKYQHVQHWDAADRTRMPIDEFDGAFIEGCIVQLSEVHKTVIVGEYYYKADPRATSRRCFIGWRHYDGVLKEARIALQRKILECSLNKS